MSESMVTTFMRAALQITGMERGLAVNMDLEILDAVNLQQEDIESERFTGADAIHKALDTGRYIISNNLRMEPSQAPTTNTNFSDLRLVVAFPVAGYGGVYLDQPIRNGMVPREVIERLMALVEHLLESQADIGEADLLALYQQMS